MKNTTTWKLGMFRLLNYICGFSPYVTEETLRPHYS
jgi:hypothetical protein